MGDAPRRSITPRSRNARWLPSHNLVQRFNSVVPASITAPHRRGSVPCFNCPGGGRRFPRGVLRAVDSDAPPRGLWRAACGFPDALSNGVFLSREPLRGRGRSRLRLTDPFATRILPASDRGAAGKQGRACEADRQQRKRVGNQAHVWRSESSPVRSGISIRRAARVAASLISLGGCSVTRRQRQPDR